MFGDESVKRFLLLVDLMMSALVAMQCVGVLYEDLVRLGVDSPLVQRIDARFQSYISIHARSDFTARSTPGRI